MREGIPLREISAAEQRRRTGVRDELRSDTLRRVERTGRQMRDAETNTMRRSAVAARVGLSTREIAQAAGVTHGTIRASAQRLGRRRAVSAPVGEQSSDTAGAG